MKSIWLKIGGAVAALAVCFILIQGGVAQDLENYKCGMEKHAHDASCYGYALTCGQDESEPHSHGTSCYDVHEDRVCSAGDDEEHEHTDSCWKTREELTCSISDVKGHNHSSACEKESLACDYTEHEHSENCTEPPEPTEPEEQEEPEEIEVTMEDFLENFTIGCYAFGNVLAPPPGRGALLKAADDTWDLKNFVTGIVIKDKDGAPVTNGNFSFGTDYTFNLTFSERTGLNGQFSYNMSGKLVYQFPEQVVIKQAVTNGVINGTNGKKIGDYTVNTSGRMEIWFGKFDSDGNTITQNFIDYYTNTTIRLDVKAQFKQNAGQIAIDFGMDTIVNITLGAPPAGITVKKTAAVFDKANETLNYTVEITAVGGKLTNITLTDTISIYNPTKPASSFQVKAGDIPGKYANPYGNVTYKINNGTAVNAGIAPSGSDMKLDLGGVTLSEGAVIKVEYKLSLKGVFDHIASQSGTNTWFQRAQYDLTIENIATVAGVNADQPGQAATGSGTAKASASSGMMTKKGVFQQGTNRIEWTASVGDGYTVLGGTKIVDALKDSQSIAGDIKLNIWNKPPANGVWGNPTHTTTTATSISGMTVNKNANGGFTFNVPDDVAGASPVYRIDFIYQTSQAQNYATNGNYNNDISITINGRTSTVTGIVNVSKNDYILTTAKTSKIIYDAAGKATAMEYTASYTIRAGSKGAVFNFYDLLKATKRISSNEISTYNVCNRPKDLKVTIEPADSNFKYYVSPTNLSTNATNKFTIYPYGTSTAKVPWPHDDQRTVTFTYRIAIDDTPMIENNAVKLRELLEGRGYKLSNALFAAVSDTGSLSASYLQTGSFDYIYLINKSGAQNGDSPALFDYKVELNGGLSWGGSIGFVGHDGYPLFMADQPAILEDTFDKDMEYVPGSLYVVREGATSGTTDQRAPAYYGPYDTKNKTDQVTVKGNSIRVDFRNMCYIGTWKGSVAQSTGLVAANNATATSNQYKYWYSYNVDGYPYKYTVYYQLRMKNNSMGYQGEGSPSTLKMENTARIYPTYPLFAGGTWESSATMNYVLPKAVTKTMNVNGNIAKAEIIINPNGTRMRPLNVANPRFTAIDIMGDTMALYQGSVKIYTKGTDGKWKTTAETPQPDGLWGVSYVSEQEMRFGLTDEKAIKITYDALILKPAGQSTSINNTITIYGQATRESKENFTVQSSATLTEGSKTGLSLYKQDEDTGASLPGAKFDMYMALKSNGAYDGKQTKLITVNAVKFYFVQEIDDSGKTSKGIYKFNNSWIRRDANPANNGVYLVRETRSPNSDYVCPDPNDPANYAYFVLDPADKAYWEDKLGKPVDILSDNYYLTNKSTLGDLAVAGEKRLTGTIPKNEGMTFWFELKQVNSDGSPYSGTAPAALKEPLYVSVPMTTDANGTYTPAQFTFDKVSGLANGDYYFMAEEVNSPLAWLAMTAPQIVRVNVFAGEATLYYPNNGSKLIFENKYKDPAAAFADVSIPVNKKVSCEDFDHSCKFTFEIEQVVKDTANGGYKPGTSNSYTLPTGSKSISITGDGLGVFILENLPAPKTSPAGTVLTYYFRIKELSGTDDNWQYDQTKHIVRAEVTFDSDRGGQAKLMYLKGESWEDLDALTFTNSFAAGGPKLPETGGAGAWPLIIAGAVWVAMLILHRITTRRGCIYNK